MKANEDTLNPLDAPKGAKKSWTIYQSLKRKIILGDLTPESPFTEQSLASDFGCSQGTIREALLLLQEDGLVDRRGYQGTYVTRTSDMEAIMLVRLRVKLECAGVEQALSHISGADMTHLRSLASLYLDCLKRGDVFSCTEVDRALHMAIFNLSRMPMLMPILKRTLLQLHRFTVSRHRGNVFWAKPEEDIHGFILDAIEYGSAEYAKSTLIDHIAASLSGSAPEVYAAVFSQDELPMAAAVNSR